MNVTNANHGSPRRVCWLLQGNEGYGARRAILNLMDGLQRTGRTTMAVCLSEGPMAEELLDRGTEVVAADFGQLTAFRGHVHNKVAQLVRHRQRTRRVIGGLMELLQGRGIDVLHCMRQTLVDVGGPVAAGIGARAVWEMLYTVGPSIPLRLSRVYYQWICWRYNVIVLANSGYTARTLGSWPVKPTVFHLGADARTFDPAAVDGVTRAELGIPESAIVLGVVARLDPRKGQDRVIEAMRIVSHDVSEPLYLLLLGGEQDNVYAHRLRELVGISGITKRVLFLGNVSEPQRYYGAMDLPISSRIDPEPFGLSVVEAMMMARPPIVHALGGPAETVVDGQTGWHVREPMAASFASGIRRALQDRARWPQMRSAARALALAEYTIERETQRYVAALN